jgi:hypothetical protein
MSKRFLRGIGVVGTIILILLYLRQPSWPTPDKLLVLMTFVFMIFNQAWAMLKRFAPFVVLLLVYESFRGLVPDLNQNVNYTWMIQMDTLAGALPTSVLQNIFWHGQVQWYDFVLYLVYMLHFVLPFELAIYVWKKWESQYWRYISTFIFLSFAGFLTYLAFPAAPPWMAARDGYIAPITRVSSEVWAALGVRDFPSIYNKISPNPVAAVPSLHAAYATVLALFVMELFRSRWRYAGWIYPMLIWFGTVYQGEHYVIDAVLGVLYAVAAYKLTPAALRAYRQIQKTIEKRLFTPASEPVLSEQND